MKKILYVGSSWAARSFNTFDGIESEYTNLLQELGLDAVNLSSAGLSNMECLDKVNNYANSVDAILWIYCEPISDVLHEHKKDLIESANFWELRSNINSWTLEMINRLNCPVGLIGGPSDIVDCDYKNITVIHPSWQKFLADQVRVNLEYGWGAEIGHRYAMYEHKNSSPSKEFVNKTADTLHSWTKMELSNIFCGVHPNKKGNELFAKEIKNSVDSFINNN